jgi:hypothetical protein
MTIRILYPNWGNHNALIFNDLGFFVTFFAFFWYFCLLSKQKTNQNLDFMDDKVKIIELQDRILELEKELLKMQEENQKLKLELAEVTQKYLKTLPTKPYLR